MHKPIKVVNLSLTFPYKICFEDFQATLLYGSRIAIIGKNGSGKSSLIKMLQGIQVASHGYIEIPKDVQFAYVPQVLEDHEVLSGGERFNKALTKALNLDPNILVLDEPTNHLDIRNRKSLMRMLNNYSGTLIVISHDDELLRNCVETFWYIDNGKIQIFSGNYDDYLRELHLQKTVLTTKLSQLKSQRKEMHTTLMKEQSRAAKSRRKGEKSINQRKWPTIVSNAKALRAQETSGRKKAAIDNIKHKISEQLSEYQSPEDIVPKFSLTPSLSNATILLSISDGCVSYENTIIATKINFTMNKNSRIGIIGENGSGKSTIIKAILKDASVTKSGNWHTPKLQDIGYLDQHYATLAESETVLETISKLAPTWTNLEVRRHLNNFLFRKNEQVNASISTLSGGEKARLCLAQIAAKTPKLLILDELTNNLDIETKAHVIQIIKQYPGALIAISHDLDFLTQIEVELIDTANLEP